MVKSGDAMRGVPALFFEGWESRSAMVGHSAGGGGACCRMDGRGLRGESGSGGGGGRGGGDILPARAVLDGGAMEFFGMAPCSGDTPRREGGGRADEPIKKWYLAGGRGGAWVGRVG